MSKNQRITGGSIDNPSLIYNVWVGLDPIGTTRPRWYQYYGPAIRSCDENRIPINKIRGKDILVVNLLKDHKDLPNWPQIEKNILEVESMGVKVIRTECDYDAEIGFFKKK